MDKVAIKVIYLNLKLLEFKKKKFNLNKLIIYSNQINKIALNNFYIFFIYSISFI